MTGQTVTLLEAIAREEGWLNPLSRCRRNNNPGNLDYKNWEQKYGAVLETNVASPRFAKFPTAILGFTAMSHLLTEVYAGQTLRQMVHHWAPNTDDNDETQYCDNLCLWAGMTQDTVLSEANFVIPISVT